MQAIVVYPTITSQTTFQPYNSGVALTKYTIQERANNSYFIFFKPTEKV
jgi:hypothetical protein